MQVVAGIGQSGAVLARLWTPERLSVLGRYTADSLSLADGATITSLSSSGGTAPTLVQYGGSLMPIYRAADSGFNNQPVIDFSPGADVCLGVTSQTQDWLNGDDFTFLVVATNLQDVRTTLFGTENGGGPQFEIRSSAHDAQQTFIVPGIFLVTANYPNPVVGKTIHVLGAKNVYNGATDMVGRVDGTPAASLQNSVPASKVLVRPVTIGRRQPWGQPYYGKLADITICASLSLSDIEKYEGWAAWKYGFVSSLPSGHPYKTFPPTV